MSPPQAKYRPALTLEEIQIILSCIQPIAHMPTVSGLNTKLRLLIAKVDLGAVQPAFTTTPKASIEDRLGIDKPELTPAQKREAAYIKYQGNPISCSDTEYKLARTYMYENNMMTDTERIEYEDTYLS